MTFFYTVLLIFFSTLSLFSQSNFNRTWYNGGGRTFRTQFTLNSTVNEKIDTTHSRYLSGGASSICDSVGNLILCSDGYNIYNSLLDYLDMGNRLSDSSFYDFEDGWSSYSQTSIFLPFDSNLYYLIHASCSDSTLNDVWLVPSKKKAPFDRLYLSKIDMNSNGGAGKVVERMKPIVKGEYISKTQMMACKHANGKDWWLLKMMHDSVSVYTFLITKDSVYNYGKQSFPYPRKTGANNIYWEIMGQIQLSPDGKKFAATCNNGHNELFLADFDRCTGQLSNMTKKNIPILPTNFPASANEPNDKYSTGICFSPNGRFIYTVNYSNIQQCDTWDPDSSTSWYHVANMDTTFAMFNGYSSAYLAFNDKMYIGNWHSGVGGLAMSVIDSPNIKGYGCGWCPKCLRFSGDIGGVTKPPCQPNYNLGKDTSINCWPLADHSVNEIQNLMEVYPNPTTGRLLIKGCKSGSVKELFTHSGQLLLRTKENELDLSRLPKGLYLLRCEDQIRKVVVE
jgi:hypothetical protein